ncbi:MAG: SGNH/GDSL hydrolase family protein [Pirellulales bacterium]|nr:SGNH/GDSL hydrolase family protein [Pirellulales bacterium]
MRTASSRFVLQWIVGAILGTVIIGVTSPWFVRSYIPLQASTDRGVWTLPPDRVYRWRSEGYADTWIGPLGMPGKRSLANRSTASLRIALWGDSQAEGVCVSDQDKLHRQLQRTSEDRWTVFPLARSGEDASVWLSQMQSVETLLSIDLHLMLIVDLPDLLAAPAAPIAPPDPEEVQQAHAAIAARLPAFVIHGARNLLTAADGSGDRQLRFSPGPADVRSPAAAPPQRDFGNDWNAVMAAIHQFSSRPVVILYAPVCPQILAGRVVADDPQQRQFAEMQSAAEAAGILVIDLRAALIRSAQQGHWPHGFHNGLIGSGHLNAQGYATIAGRCAEVLDSTARFAP